MDKEVKKLDTVYYKHRTGLSKGIVADVGTTHAKLIFDEGVNPDAGEWCPLNRIKKVQNYENIRRNKNSLYHGLCLVLSRSIIADAISHTRDVKLTP